MAAAPPQFHVPPLQGLLIEEGGVAAAQAATPPPIQVSASIMPPVAAAGIRLAVFVLRIAAFSIPVLIVYLLVMDVFVASEVRDSYRQVLNPSRVGAEFYALGQLEKIATDLNAARVDPNWQWPADSLQNAKSVVATLKQLPSLTAEQKSVLDYCVSAPTSNVPSAPPGGRVLSRDEKLDRCLATIENVRQEALEAAGGANSAQTAAESATKINDQLQSFHAFWMQVAQLILLNLLLPLLTALFGYIFGTQQAQRQG